MSTLINGQESVMPIAMSYPLWVRVRHQGYGFSRRDALEFGTSDEQLQAWHTRGDVLRGAQGVYYLPDSSPPGPGNDCERRKLRAVLLALGDAFFATHQSALLAWGLPVYPLHSVQDVHVGRQGTRHWSRRPGIHLHRTSSRASVTIADGIRTVNAADAIAGVGARMGIEAAVVAADAALHRDQTSRCPSRRCTAFADPPSCGRCWTWSMRAVSLQAKAD